MGISLTFLLLCVNAVYIIAVDLNDFMPGAPLEEFDTTALDRVEEGLTTVNPDVDRQQYSSVRTNDYREREQALDQLLWNMVFGWQALFRDILSPYGLVIISEMLNFILTPIQIVSLGYLAMLTITALRGGFSA